MVTLKDFPIDIQAKEAKVKSLFVKGVQNIFLAFREHLGVTVKLKLEMSEAYL